MVNRILPLSLLAAAALGACAHDQPTASNQVAFTAQSSQTTPPPANSSTLLDVAKAVADNHIDVPFTNGSARLSPEAEAKLDLAARLFRDASPALMFSAGCTDTVGSEYSNLLLSAQRAAAVKRALADRGIPADRVQIRALGESDLANASNPASPENRRVTITWRLI